MAASHTPPSAILLVIAATACFTSLDVTVKYLSQRYPVPLLVWARYGVQALVMLAFLAPRLQWTLVRTAHPPLMIVRGITLLMSSLCFFTALRYLPLAEATALNYSTPIVVTLAAGTFLHEHITIPRWIFVFAGFVGMLLIVRPGSDVLGAPSLFALGAAMFYASFQILTRKLAGEDAMSLLFYPALCGGLLMTACLPFFDYHAHFPPLDMLLILAIGVVGTVGHFLFILAFQRASASSVTPFTYMQVVWSTIAGWLVFDAFPDHWALAGMVVIASSGFVLSWYERWRAGVDAGEPAGVD